MTRSEAKIHEVKELIVSCLNLTDIRAADIEDGAPLFIEGLGLDSVDALELVVGIEKEFGLSIEDEEIGKEAFASAAALTAFINSRLPSASRDPIHEQ